MSGDNLLRSGLFSEVKDATADSHEYFILQKNVLIRHKAYQNYINKVCNSNIDYSSNEAPNAYTQCANDTLSKLAPIVKSAEAYYDKLHSNKYNVVPLVEHLKQIDADEQPMRIRKENEKYRFGTGSFFDKYRSFSQ